MYQNVTLTNQDTTKPPDRPDPTEYHFFVPVGQTPIISYTDSPSDRNPNPAPCLHDDQLSEQHLTTQNAQLREMNAVRRLKTLPAITNTKTLVERFLEDLNNLPSYAIHVIKPNDPRISEFKDVIRDEDERLEKLNVFQR